MNHIAQLITLYRSGWSLHRPSISHPSSLLYRYICRIDLFLRETLETPILTTWVWSNLVWRDFVLDGIKEDIEVTKHLPDLKSPMSLEQKTHVLIILSIIWTSTGRTDTPVQYGYYSKNSQTPIYSFYSSYPVSIIDFLHPSFSYVYIFWIFWTCHDSWLN